MGRLLFTLSTFQPYCLEMVQQGVTTGPKLTHGQEQLGMGGKEIYAIERASDGALLAADQQAHFYPCLDLVNSRFQALTLALPSGSGPSPCPMASQNPIWLVRTPYG